MNAMKNYVKALILCVVCLAVLAVGMRTLGLAQQSGNYVPGLWRGDVQQLKPDMSGLPPLRIYTEADYPPFNYYDEDGALSGFNVELIQAVCEVLGVTCTIEARDWELLLPSLGRGEVDIVAASIAISKDSLKIADFSDRYYETPARFIIKKNRDILDITPEALAGKTVGVITGTSHEAYLGRYYSGIKLVPSKDRDELHKALVAGKVDLAFDDGITSVFWLNGTESNSCCVFRGGPLIDHQYFGSGVGFAIKKNERRLRELVNYALEKVRRDGIYEELFLRYFPLSFY